MTINRGFFTLMQIRDAAVPGVRRCGASLVQESGGVLETGAGREGCLEASA